MSTKIYKQSLALLTDVYQITMAYAYWKSGLAEKEASFHLFFRKPPFQGGFTIAAGLEAIIEYLENLQFDSSDLSYLQTLTADDGSPLFPDPFLEYLAKLTLTVDVDAVAEGTVIFPYQPVVRVQGPLIQAQILESPLLNLFNYPSLIATKAARICLAAKGDPVIEFGFRRSPGADGALTAARAAYIGGCAASSTLLAGKLFGIPVRGTHAHSWVMVFDREIESFETYASVFPNNCTFLVDTYNTLEGVRKAIEVGKRLQANGHRMLGIRLDSGDLAYLSIKSRQMLDEAGFPEAKIVVSNELDEYVISELKRQGARIDVWGVGTNLVTGKDHPALDGVYKLSAVRDPGQQWDYKLKLSEQLIKVTNPGVLQVRRFHNGAENVADAIYSVDQDLSKGCEIVDPFDRTRRRKLTGDLHSRDLLVPIFRGGKRVYTLPSLEAIQENTRTELSRFHEGIKRFLNPHQYAVGLEKTLYDEKVRLIEKIRREARN